MDTFVEQVLNAVSNCMLKDVMSTSSYLMFNVFVSNKINTQLNVPGYD